uniref:Uncharacterized protein n=1 Tax=Physcomitrium patens TaxID=3218 RepID=A0A2K1K8K1_PHYPA|nr:hypothetical protein PHYPA_012000 [Physcomitrium patens]
MESRNKTCSTARAKGKELQIGPCTSGSACASNLRANHRQIWPETAMKLSKNLFGNVPTRRDGWRGQFCRPPSKT